MLVVEVAAVEEPEEVVAAVAVEAEVVGEEVVGEGGDVVSTLVILFPALWILMISEGGADCQFLTLNVGRHSVRGFGYHLYYLSFVYSKISTIGAFLRA